MGKTVTKLPAAASLSPGDLARVQRLADVLAYSPDVIDLLGPNVDVRVAITPTGGLVFEFEPAPARDD